MTSMSTGIFSVLWTGAPRVSVSYCTIKEYYKSESLVRKHKVKKSLEENR